MWWRLEGSKFRKQHTHRKRPNDDKKRKGKQRGGGGIGLMVRKLETTGSLGFQDLYSRYCNVGKDKSNVASDL